MYRVLVVDDHRVFRATVLAFLQSQGDIQVVGEAANGREAVEKTCALQPDVVVMDVSMPLMNGIEATRRIKEARPAVRVIGLSALDEEPVRLEFRRAGAEICLSKSEIFLSAADPTGTLMSVIRSDSGQAAL